MKMGSGLFWGILLIIIGVSFIIKIVFNIDFPIFKIIIAFFFIYLGLKIILGDGFSFFNKRNTETDVVFGESNFNNINHGKDYNVVFSKGNFDLRNITLNDSGPTCIKINTVFGGSDLWLSKSMPVRVSVDAAFAGAQMPNGNSAAFGSTLYASENLDITKPFLDVKADVVFGGLRIHTF
jgi:predicted membrane protein